MLRALSQAFALLCLLQSATALPTAQSNGLKIVKTTTLPNGQVLDWVTIESQSDEPIASPPPLPAGHKRSPMQELPEHLQGPAGTVPRLRVKGTYPQKRLPTPADNNTLSHHAQPNAAQAGPQGQHWYGSSGQSVNNLGGGGMFSLYHPYLQSNNDFSLIQTAVIRDNAANSRYGTTSQTVEAGWQHYPGSGISQPHLFTYFTTCGYQCSGDNQGGYNTDQKGWVQQDSTIYPGYVFNPMSVDGGAQYDKQITYVLMNGNWWLYVQDRYIGYYPASVFSQGVNQGDTLGSYSTRINFYGEIYNSETTVTTTDMGSGEFPEAGAGRAAYIKNIEYFDTGNNAQFYDGSAQIIQSDTSRYRIQQHFSNRDGMGSYAYIGGPGAGGRVGG